MTVTFKKLTPLFAAEVSPLDLNAVFDQPTLDALVAEVEGSFDTRGADVRRHVLEFVRTLQDEGVLPRDFELA